MAPALRKVYDQMPEPRYEYLWAVVRMEEVTIIIHIQ